MPAWAGKRTYLAKAQMHFDPVCFREGPILDAPRQLPRALLNKLDEIAQLHGGEVPIHGRLFAQWLHLNAYDPLRPLFPYMGMIFGPRARPRVMSPHVKV